MTKDDDKKRDLVSAQGNTNLIGDALNNLDAKQLEAVRQKAAEEALRLQSKQIEQENDYLAGQRDIREHVRTWDGLDKEGKLTRHKVVSDVNTGTGKTTIESRSGASTCFVATAAYNDDPYHPNVVLLRSWRDNTLSNSKAGNSFIDFYWKVGPKLAVYVKKYSPLKIISRVFISIIVLVISIISGRKN